jgi:hypothetical protein
LGPNIADRASLAAPVIHNFYPYLAPPWLTGSNGAYKPAYRYLFWSQGCNVLASQAPPLQSQKCDDLNVPSAKNPETRNAQIANIKRYFIKYIYPQKSNNSINTIEIKN